LTGESEAAPAMTQPESQADPYQGMSREAVLREHMELKDKFETISKERKELADFVGRVSPFFKQENNQVSFNEDMVRQFVEAKGWYSSPNGEQYHDQNEAVSNNNNGGSPDGQEDGFMDSFTEDPRAAIRQMFKEELMPEIKNLFSESVTPLQQQVTAEQHQRWNAEMASKYPDWQKWRTKTGEYVGKKKLPLHSLQDLEDAYLSAKAVNKGFVDKEQYDAHVRELQNTLQTIRPGAGQPRISDDEATNAQLLGIEQFGDEKTQSVTQALFGKSNLKP
jgi:hypothetical protein